MPRRTCEFCGDESADVNREHVWPEWLGQAILRTANIPTWILQRGQVQKRIRLGLRLNITTRCACEHRCNGGWMNRLEQAVIPFLRGMAIEGQVTLLDDARKTTLAAWCMKTAMVYEFLNPQVIKYFTANERQHLMTYLQPPPNVHIWIGDFQGPSRAHGAPFYFKTAGDMVSPSGYSLTLTANRFLMQMLAFRDVVNTIPGSAPRLGGLQNGMLMRMWPLQSPGVIERWPPTVPVDGDNLDEFENRFWPRIRLIAPPERPTR